MSAYDYVLTAAAAHVVLGSSKRWRQVILAELDRLAAQQPALLVRQVRQLVEDFGQAHEKNREWAMRVFKPNVEER